MKKLLSLLLVFIVNIYAEDMNVSVSQINSGFIKKPPLELTKKFPMCDAFLNVDWIDKTKKIGYSTYDLYKKGKKDGKFYSLVMMSEGMHLIGLDAYSYKRQGKLKELFEAVRKGKMVGARIKYKNKFYDLYGAPYETSLADNRINVCIEHPDNGRAWIVEGKHINNVYDVTTAETKLQILQSILNTDSKLLIRDRKFIEGDGFIVIDVNYDGKDDYFSIFELQTPIFSIRNEYRKPQIVKRTQNIQKEEMVAELSFLPNQKICTLPIGSSYHYLTTDGYNYYLGNKCNLTELTKGEK